MTVTVAVITNSPVIASRVVPMRGALVITIMAAAMVIVVIVAAIGTCGGSVRGPRGRKITVGMEGVGVPVARSGFGVVCAAHIPTVPPADHCGDGADTQKAHLRILRGNSARRISPKTTGNRVRRISSTQGYGDEAHEEIRSHRVSRLHLRLHEGGCP